MDHVAHRDQLRARIDTSWGTLVVSCIQLTLAHHRAARQPDVVERTINRMAWSRIRLSEARRTLAQPLRVPPPR